VAGDADREWKEPDSSSLCAGSMPAPFGCQFCWVPILLAKRKLKANVAGAMKNARWLAGVSRLLIQVWQGQRINPPKWSKVFCADSKESYKLFSILPLDKTFPQVFPQASSLDEARSSLRHDGTPGTQPRLAVQRSMSDSVVINRGPPFRPADTGRLSGSDLAGEWGTANIPGPQERGNGGTQS
jgi:hypothetical protein